MLRFVFWFLFNVKLSFNLSFFYEKKIQIIAALGQNFLLIIDFVRSYAQLKEEHYTSSDLDISDVFNSTIDFNSLINDEIQFVQEKLL